MVRRHPAAAISRTYPLQVTLANRDGWFFTAIAGGATVLAVPLLVWLKGDIAQDEPLGVGAVMLGSGAIGCFLYAALKFLRAVREFHEPSFIPMLLTAGLGLTGLFVAVSPYFRSHAIKAGVLALLLAVLIVCIGALPFRKYIQSRLRLVVLLMTLAALPLFLVAAAVIEFHFHLKGSWDVMSSSAMIFPEYIPLSARRPVLRLNEYLSVDAPDYAIQTCWLAPADLKAIALDPLSPLAGKAWGALLQYKPAVALEAALSIPTASPATIPLTKHDDVAGVCIGRRARADDVRARLRGQYSVNLKMGVFTGLQQAQRHLQFLPEIVACIERNELPYVAHCWEMLGDDPQFRDALLRRHLESNNAVSRAIIAAVEYVNLDRVARDVIALALKSDDPNARMLILASANTLTVNAAGKLAPNYKFNKAEWRLILAIVSGDALNTTDSERILAAMLLQRLGIETSARRLEGTPGLDAELKLVVREARPLIEKLEE